MEMVPGRFVALSDSITKIFALHSNGFKDHFGGPFLCGALHKIRLPADAYVGSVGDDVFEVIL